MKKLIAVLVMVSLLLTGCAGNGAPEFQGIHGMDIIFLLLAVVMIGVGIYFLVSPEDGWQWTIGRFAESGEPNDMGLLWTRLEGISIILFGLYVIVDVVRAMFGL